MNREDNVNWFHGKISRDTAEKLLKEGRLSLLLYVVIVVAMFCVIDKLEFGWKLQKERMECF